jgi:hypothetical protein
MKILSHSHATSPIVISIIKFPIIIIIIIIIVIIIIIIIII